MNCRYCGINLDDGDIFEELAKANIYDEAELLRVAHSLGWTKENKKRFSKCVVVEQYSKFEICPECKGVWPDPELKDCPKIILRKSISV